MERSKLSDRFFYNNSPVNISPLKLLDWRNFRIPLTTSLFYSPFFNNYIYQNSRYLIQKI